MRTLLRAIVFVLIARPFAFLVLGFNVLHRERLVRDGPAIIAANHNSHLDTLLLYALFPVRLLPKLRPVAAADYFLKDPFVRWLTLNIVGILPIRRDVRAHHDPLEGLRAALARGEILFVFPEGSRGEPERLGAFKSGIAHLAEDMPNVPVVPVFLHGAGRTLPKGSGLLVPFRCAGAIGQPIRWSGDRKGFMTALRASFDQLEGEVARPKTDES